MTIEEIKALSEAIKTGGETLTNYIAGLKPSEPQSQAITLDGVTKFLSENEDGKKYLQSFSDKRVTDGIDTFKKNNLQKLLDDEIKKKFPEMDPKDKALKDLEAKISKMEADSLRKDLTNTALKTLTEKNLPSQLADFIVGSDEDTTKKNLETLVDVFSKYGESVKTEFTKSNSYTPPKEEHKPTDEEAKAINDAKAVMEKTMGIKFDK